MFLTSTALALGFMHGLGADHLTAIAALSMGSRPQSLGHRGHPFRIAVRFAFGHALLLALGASAALTLGWTIPAVVERAGEMVGGVLLIVLGVIGLWLAGTLTADAHLAQAPRAQARWHHALAPAPWHRHHRFLAHTPISIALGAVFAISTLRALVLLAPFGLGSSPSGQGLDAAATSLALLLWLIVVFAVGIVVSMSLFGIVLARVMSAARMARVSRAAAIVTALASIGLGVYWVSLRS